MELPLVSCIMPTANREKFIPLAIEYYLRQTYKNKELIILDDGNESISNLIPADPSICYYEKAEKKVIGAKRNDAIGLSKGEIIVHMDDDDWYAPDWIERQVKCLTETKADICGLSKLLFYNPLHKRSFQYIYPNGDSWVAGATMAYWKRFWEERKFDNIQVSEDNQFIKRPGIKIANLNYFNGLVSMLHPGNTSPKCIWIPVEEGVVRTVMGADLDKTLDVLS